MSILAQSESVVLIYRILSIKVAGYGDLSLLCETQNFQIHLVFDRKHETIGFSIFKNMLRSIRIILILILYNTCVHVSDPSPKMRWEMMKNYIFYIGRVLASLDTFILIWMWWKVIGEIWETHLVPQFSCVSHPTTSGSSSSSFFLKVEIYSKKESLLNEKKKDGAVDVDGRNWIRLDWCVSIPIALLKLERTCGLTYHSNQNGPAVYSCLFTSNMNLYTRPFITPRPWLWNYTHKSKFWIWVISLVICNFFVKTLAFL
jgi:hypothetical protein